MHNLIDEAFGMWLSVGQSSAARPVPPPPQQLAGPQGNLPRDPNYRYVPVLHHELSWLAPPTGQKMFEKIKATKPNVQSNRFFENLCACCMLVTFFRFVKNFFI